MINVNKEIVDTITSSVALALLCAGTFAIGAFIGKYTSDVDENAIKAAEAAGYLKCLTDALETLKDCSKETTN